ncbi:hypothetical protein HYALB_00007928 [Hymenoscyphus albidus]|uniref:Uncharacterized protein n=1 Tax=Hymenoscyphus albidus TaxID=595503 RepID=A0A9N9LPZ8_9HELO|nr:hypothetical protein HYALB_00007928 [Hymenoscyphus albidus]
MQIAPILMTMGYLATMVVAELRTAYTEDNGHSFPANGFIKGEGGTQLPCTKSVFCGDAYASKPGGEFYVQRQCEEVFLPASKETAPTREGPQEAECKARDSDEKGTSLYLIEETGPRRQSSLGNRSEPWRKR